MTFVGLDVHARQTHAAIMDLSSGELRVSRLRMAPVEVVCYPGPGGAWTAKHLAPGCAPTTSNAPCAQGAFVDYLAAVEMLAGRRGTLIGALEHALPDSSHAAVVTRLRCFRAGSTRSPVPALGVARRLAAVPAACAALWVPGDRGVPANLGHQAPSRLDH